VKMTKKWKREKEKVEEVKKRKNNFLLEKQFK
jgi:hypothetical protein